MAISDPIREGLARGWKVTDASRLTRDLALEADVVVVGTGAGGGVTAEILTKAGLAVILVEEGGLKSSSDFKMREGEAYPELYQESAARKTLDKSINILQGRTVGGSTTINWTSSFRTPPATLEYWQSEFGLADLGREALAPWFERMEARLDIAPWNVAPNENNDLLRRGAEKLGISSGLIRRNVRGCWNLGYCGMGCPTNAKQSMLVTTIPSALDAGAQLLTRARAERLRFAHGSVESLECRALDAAGTDAGPQRITLRARHYVLAAGAIGSPGVLLRSAAPDPHRNLGARTFLHPVVISSALMPQAVDGYKGAPQTVYSDHYLEQGPVSGPIGFKLEAPPIHPVLYGITLQGFGAEHKQLMKEFANVHALLALLRDGFNPGSPGGIVGLRNDGSPVLSYPLTPFVWDGARRALLAMAELQFAAGAKRVYPVHEQVVDGYGTWKEAKAGIERLPLVPFQTRLVSAHVMGGCGMAGDPRRGVVDSRGRHWQIGNLSVHDGSLFPTSIGANPQLSIYGLVARNASLLAEALTKRPAPAIV
jgi:choline dehydrogenase-like flavoprotein